MALTADVTDDADVPHVMAEAAVFRLLNCTTETRVFVAPAPTENWPTIWLTKFFEAWNPAVPTDPEPSTRNTRSTGAFCVQVELVAGADDTGAAPMGALEIAPNGARLATGAEVTPPPLQMVKPAFVTL
jgi:hypothetical protein